MFGVRPFGGQPSPRVLLGAGLPVRKVCAGCGVCGPRERPVVTAMRIAGCDYSTHAIDLVSLPWDDGGPPKWRRIDLDGWDHGAFPATLRVRGRMRGTHSFFEDVANLYLEKPFGLPQTMWALGLVAGAIVASLPQQLVEEGAVSQINQPEWTRKLTGRGDTSKDDRIEHLRGLGFDLGAKADHNAYDALGIAYVAREEILHAFRGLKSA